MTVLDLSVVVPCRDVAATLPAQLDALVAQEWDGAWEVVVVDNGSRDDTVAIAERYGRDSQGRVRVVAAHAGTGVSYVRNAGVRASGARAVVFCDGDDIVERGWVAAMGDALGDHELVTGTLDLTALNPPGLARSRGPASADAIPHFGAVPFARGNNGGMQRSLFDTLGGYDESFLGLEDIELSLRAAALGATVTLVPEARLRYRYRDGLGALWRQGLFYGGSLPELARRARALGLRPPDRFAGLRSWAWLVVHLPDALTHDGRLAWTWVLANRLGVLRGALQTRSLHV